MSFSQAIITVLVIAAGTLATRALAFLLFPAGRAVPSCISYLGKVLPSATIALLIVYCVKHVEPLEPPYGLAELAAIILVAVLQHFFKIMLLSIIAGTAAYMLLLQWVFV